MLSRNVKLCFQKSEKISGKTENTTEMPSENGFFPIENNL
ncbi:hypothetical protein NEIPOLOT_02580 [Neisseria polysaccharea ATCC 43768]|nr:hypothetical protein NEIPOLOT_02580 [Neisseria polysaccharea ATCC 43768]